MWNVLIYWFRCVQAAPAALGLIAELAPVILAPREGVQETCLESAVPFLSWETSVVFSGVGWALSEL